MNKLVLILEDQETDKEILELRFRSIGFEPVSCISVNEAIKVFNKFGDVYSMYLLDMKTPIDAGGDLYYAGGLQLREFLIEHKVESNKIYLMSAGVSSRDEMAAREYSINPLNILSKADITERELCKLLKANHFNL